MWLIFLICFLKEITLILWEMTKLTPFHHHYRILCIFNITLMSQKHNPPYPYFPTHQHWQSWCKWAMIWDGITHHLRHFLWRFLLSPRLHVLMSINPAKRFCQPPAQQRPFLSLSLPVFLFFTPSVSLSLSLRVHALEWKEQSGASSYSQVMRLNFGGREMDLTFLS